VGWRRTLTQKETKADDRRGKFNAESLSQVEEKRRFWWVGVL